MSKIILVIAADYNHYLHHIKTKNLKKEDTRFINSVSKLRSSHPEIKIHIYETWLDLKSRCDIERLLKIKFSNYKFFDSNGHEFTYINWSN